MCELCGVLLHPEHRRDEAWRFIAKTFTDCLVFNEQRGREATGAALIRRDGQVKLLKRPIHASVLVESEAYLNLLESLGPEVVCMLGHSRKPTKGDPGVDGNNHPIVTEHVLGIHNGIIINDDALFARHGFRRTAQVDSEIIFHLLGVTPPQDQLGRTQTRPFHAVEELEGTFATLSVDLRKPANLLALRRGRPLNLHFDSRTNALYFSSRYVFLRKIFGRAVIHEIMRDGYGYLFDANHLPEDQWRAATSFAMELNDAPQP